ncbi:MBL fold metallo-hydrolase [Nesterenkonia marinintestina]|uniref:MBL fold metallo-hydrolase n=1 Tax=Nesterenkonia marinintestina TaxID=2979865 RepID=UPI0021C1E663|nr:MBL fold metallo-hydrolase [Nesterenkonia sp. GX14115]
MRTTEWARSILCDNPSPMTLEGTLTYVLGTGDDDVVLVDPGPDGHPQHLDAVAEVVGERRVTQILVTHRHRDHTGAAEAFAARFGAPVRGFDAEQCRPAPDTAPDAAPDSTDDVTAADPAPLIDGETLQTGSRTVEVIHTPGHTADSICLWIAPDRTSDADPDDAGAMLTGDTILGRGTTMLDFPDGTLTDYLESLQRLRVHGDDAAVLPAHGPRLDSLGDVVAQYLQHRHDRLDQVRELLRTHGPDTDHEQLAALIYGESVPAGSVVTAKIIGAQVDHLHRLGEL